MTFLRSFAIVLVLLFYVQFIHAQSNVQTINPTFTTIDVPGAAYTNASGINRDGDIVGSYGQDTSTDAHGFLYSNGLFSYFDYPDGQNWTIPRGLNDSQLIVGYADHNPVTGFLYDGTSFTTLKDGSNSATFSEGI